MLLRRLAPLLLVLLLAPACGGGGGPATGGAPTPPAADFGTRLLGNVARGGVAGCWGYTAPDGARYALMGTAKGVLVVDLRLPSAPRVVAEVDGPVQTTVPGIYWRELRTHGSYAYICSEQTDVRGGVMILDLSGLPASVRYVRSFIPRDGRLNAHTLDIDPETGLLYLQRYTNQPAPGERPLPHDEREPFGEPGSGSIEIWDLRTDPEQPTYLTTFNQNHFVHDMTARGGRCYVAEGSDSAYSVWDVSNPRAPSLIVRWAIPDGHFAHNIWPAADGSLVATTVEVPRGQPARLWSLEGSNPPRLRGSLQHADATPHNVVLEGARAYLSHYTSGLVVADISDPDRPVLVGTRDTTPAEGSSYEGCWGVYKFPGAPLMLGSDISRGLFVVEISAP